MKHTGAFSAAILFALGAAAQLAFAEDLPPLKIGLMLPYKGVYAVPSEGIDRGFQVADVLARIAAIWRKGIAAVARRNVEIAVRAELQMSAIVAAGIPANDDLLALGVNPQLRVEFHDQHAGRREHPVRCPDPGRRADPRF